MCTFPAVENQFVLREIVESPYNRSVFHPDDELGNFHTNLNAGLPESEYHLVRVEDVDAVFLGQLGEWRLKPALSELHILLVRHESIVRDVFVLRNLADTPFAFSVINGVRRVSQNQVNIAMHREIYFR